MENWKHIGVLFTGIAALITASIPIFDFLNTTNKQNITNIQQLQTQTAIINDPDGWVNLRTNPSINSRIIIKIENGYKIQILEQNGNWYKVKTSIGDIGYIYSDRLQLQQ